MEGGLFDTLSVLHFQILAAICLFFSVARFILTIESLFDDARSSASIDTDYQWSDLFRCWSKVECFCCLRCARIVELVCSGRGHNRQYIDNFICWVSLQDNQLLGKYIRQGMQEKKWVAVISRMHSEAVFCRPGTIVLVCVKRTNRQRLEIF